MTDMHTDLRSKFSARLAEHVYNVKLEPLCRLTMERVAMKALPNIGLIELVSGDDFARLYHDLYISMFGHYERERSELIVVRLKQEFAGKREGLAAYRIVGIRDHAGNAIGAAQFSVLFLPGTPYAVPYLQYIYVRSENRRQDMAEVLHTMVLAVATADAAKEQRSVPCTLFECEPPGYGTDKQAQEKSTQRVQIHTRAGASALMLRRLDTSALRTSHIQPGLEPSDPPMILVWAVRRSPCSEQQCDVRIMGKQLLTAYYQSLRDEGFPLSNIALAESMMNERCNGCEFVLMPLADVMPTPEEYMPN